MIHVVLLPKRRERDVRMMHAGRTSSPVIPNCTALKGSSIKTGKYAGSSEPVSIYILLSLLYCNLLLYWLDVSEKSLKCRVLKLIQGRSCYSSAASRPTDFAPITSILGLQFILAWNVSNLTCHTSHYILP